MIRRAMERLKGNMELLLFPIGLDLFGFFLGLLTIGFFGTSKVVFKFSLDIGLPTLNSVLDYDVILGGLHLDLGGEYFSGFMAIFLVSIILGAFIEAGFIGLIYQVVTDSGPVGIKGFWEYGKRFWARFLGLRLILTLVLMGTLVLLSALGILGLVLYFIGFMVLRILYIYWEFTIVSQDCSIGAGFTLSRGRFDNRIPETHEIILAIIGLGFVLGLGVHLVWDPFTVLVAIFVYNYFATGLQLALMDSLLTIIGKGEM